MDKVKKSCPVYCATLLVGMVNARYPARCAEPVDREGVKRQVVPVDVLVRVAELYGLELFPA